MTAAMNELISNLPERLSEVHSGCWVYDDWNVRRQATKVSITDSEEVFEYVADYRNNFLTEIWLFLPNDIEHLKFQTVKWAVVCVWVKLYIF